LRVNGLEFEASGSRVEGKIFRAIGFRVRVLGYGI
jgi:hypothetical protein